MSLLSQIQNNTSSVVNGKLNLAQAITNKGGVLNDYTLVPSFSNLTSGVGSIFSIRDINGAIETKIFANSAISKGDVLALEKPEVSGYVATRKYVIPATAMLETTSKSLYNSATPKVLANGEMVVAFVTDGSIMLAAVFFYKVNDNYVQLTLDGSYANTFRLRYKGSGSSSSNFYTVQKNSFFFDSAKKLLFACDADKLSVFKLDLDNLNLIQQASLTWNRSATGNIWVHNNNVFVNCYAGTGSYTYQYFYDETTQTITSVGEVVRSMSTAPVTTSARGAFDYTYDAFDNIYVYVTGFKSTWFAAIRKLSLDANGIYQPSGKDCFLTNVMKDWFYNGSSTSATSTENDPFLNMNFACTSAVYIDTTNKFHYIAIDTDTMTATEIDVPFSDGLDVTQIANLKLVKGKQFLYVKSNDTTNYTDDERVRLYHYNIDEGYEFVGCPANFFNPPVKALAIPPIVPDSLMSDLVPYMLPTSDVAIYEVKVNEVEYEYTGQPCNNMLAGAAAYAVATQAIAANEIGKGLLILS